MKTATATLGKIAAVLALGMMAAAPALAQSSRIAWLSAERIYNESKLAKLADNKLREEFSSREKALQELAMSFSPRQADVLICAGRVPFKLAPVIRRIWQQMTQPKWAIAMGACASTGNIFDNYAVVQGIDTIIPVDVYVPGCPPRPEGLMYGIMLLQEKVKRERMNDKVIRAEMEPDPKSKLYIPPPVIDELSEPFGNSVHQTRSGL